VWQLLLVVLGVIALAVPGLTAEAPRYGGLLRVALPAEPPSLDPHQEQAPATLMLVAPLYNTLLQFHPTAYPQIIGDLAASWTISEDGLVYTFALHQGVTFHDGSALTAADVKASYEKILWPPPGVSSPRQATFPAVESITAADPHTVLFTLKAPAASMLFHVASPWNVIYPKKYLDQNPQYFKTNVLGSGPFRVKSYRRGVALEVEKNPHYWVQERPYLDGVQLLFFREGSALIQALQADQVDIAFRPLPPVEVDALLQRPGDMLQAQAVDGITFWGISPNLTRPPLHDERVRTALTLALDRASMARALAPVTGLQAVGGLLRPGTPWALTAAELAQLPGYGTDPEASRTEARRLLAEAGYNENNPLRVVLKNRNVRLPNIDFGLAIIAAWQKIGVQVEHRLEDAVTWNASAARRDFTLLVTEVSDYADDPDVQLSHWLSGSAQNYPGLADPTYEQLFAQQSRERDPQKRLTLVKEMQQLLLGKTVFIQGLWSARAVVHAARVKNYVAHPSHYTNQRLQDVWLAQ
jgi:peptide/nickel transport system substrate-binding protein